MNEVFRAVGCIDVYDVKPSYYWLCGGCVIVLVLHLYCLAILSVH